VAETLVVELKKQTQRLASAAMVILVLIGTYIVLLKESAANILIN
jgi:hypothetical protein